MVPLTAVRGIQNIRLCPRSHCHVRVVNDFADTTVLACSYGAQVEFFDKKGGKSRDTVPLKPQV